MAWQNNLREITKIIYRLKRSYGLPATIKRVSSQSHDVETGKITRTFETFSINRAILLPEKLGRDFVYDLTFIAANNNFTSGAFFDQNSRTMIIDARDLPKDFELALEQHVEFDDKRYTISSVTRAEKKSAWILTLKNLTNENVVQS